MFIAALFTIVLALAGETRAGWFDASWKFRRSIEAIWDAEHGTGEQLCFATFYTAGHMKPSGPLSSTDLRVATEDGKLVPSRVIDITGDRVRVVFSTPKMEKKFYVYFGNDAPTPPPANVGELKMTAGLLLESKRFIGGPHDSMEELRDTWERSSPIIGATMIDKPFYGYNPATEEDRTITRISGPLFAPVDGEYLFAGSADDRAAMYIDGKPALLMQGLVGDIRFNTQLRLTRGRHDFVVYHLNTGLDFRVSVGWRVPGYPKVDVISQEAFGATPRGVVGRLEEFEKPMTADFQAENRGEFFVADKYCHRYRLSARAPENLSNVEYDWDFGDGQTGTGSVVDHVFLDSGTFPIRCTFRIGANSDAQTTKFIVMRNYERLTNAQLDDAKDQSKFVARDDFAKLPPDELPQGTLLLARAGDADGALAAAMALAAAKTHPNRTHSIEALAETAKLALGSNKTQEVAAMWDAVPVDSDINPDAACAAGDFFLWRMADFDHAIKLLDPLKSTHDPRLLSRYAQALLMAQKADEARKIFDAIPTPGQPVRQAAMSGASARTIEFFIHDNDPEAGEDAWEQWNARTPADFLEGYSLLLRVRLMELRKLDSAAAKVAEAFANAVPTSSYSPKLLDEASRLLKTSDEAKSAALRELLKKRYPEDPLSQ